MTADCEHNSVLFWATSNINGLQSATVCHFDYKQYQGLKTVAEGGRNCRATVSVLEKRNHAQPPATAPQLRRNRRATVSFPISATAATVSLRGTVAGAQGLLWLHHTLARPDPLAPRSARRGKSSSAPDDHCSTRAPVLRAFPVGRGRGWRGRERDMPATRVANALYLLGISGDAQMCYLLAKRRRHLILYARGIPAYWI